MIDIKSLEAEELSKRSLTIVIADWLTTSFGSITFLLFNFLFFIVWILINTGYIAGFQVFDPFPFILLTMVVSLEAIFLSIIVLMSQNRQSAISTLREELDMQVDLVAEREITKILYLLTLLLKKEGVTFSDPEISEMIKKTDISYIERQLKEQISIANRKSKNK
ncbi:MAG TPA: DUF1003 domain-containing protein [Patescibacteria group bacterium]|nr:DUF1003 domain-containing protein [Patescibacteria group bacterium]